MHALTLVKQEDDTGCGIACLAMITRQSYQNVKRKLSEQLNWTSRKGNLRTRPSHLISFLAEHNITAEPMKFPGWNQLDGTSILGVNSDGKNGYHWVIVVKNSDSFLIIDPIDGQVYQAESWINDDDGYTANPRSAYFKLLNFRATKIII